MKHRTTSNLTEKFTVFVKFQVAESRVHKWSLVVTNIILLLHQVSKPTSFKFSKRLSKNFDGWKLHHVCALLVLTAKTSRGPDTTLGKISRIAAVIANFVVIRRTVRDRFLSQFTNWRLSAISTPLRASMSCISAQLCPPLCKPESLTRCRNVVVRKLIQQNTPTSSGMSSVKYSDRREIWIGAEISSSQSPFRDILTKTMTHLGRFV